MRLDDVARKAGVSISTVSRVVNDVGLVKPSTRDRVMKALEEVSYYPDLHARSLAAGRTRTIGIIVSDIQNPFFADVFGILERDAHAAGYEVLVANTNYERDQLVVSVHLMLGRRVAGLAVMVSEMEPHLVDELTRAGVPFVFFDAVITGRKVPKIRFDFRKGMRLLVEHLFSMGHRRMAYIGHAAALQSTDERKAAFIETATRHAIEFQFLTASDRDAFVAGRDAVRELLGSGFEPTAILCVNDITAVGVLRELRNRGIQVPGDVAVTGFDNIRLAEFSCPSLTTIHIPREQIGHLVFNHLVPNGPKSRLIRDEYFLDPELIVRESTAPASGRTMWTTG